MYWISWMLMRLSVFKVCIWSHFSFIFIVYEGHLCVLVVPWTLELLPFHLGHFSLTDGNEFEFSNSIWFDWLTNERTNCTTVFFSSFLCPQNVNSKSGMAESIVSDWLAEYAALEATELQSFIADHENNHEVSSALFTIINERLKYPDVSIQVTSIESNRNTDNSSLYYEHFHCRSCIRCVINCSVFIVPMKRNWKVSRCNSYRH